MENLAPLAAAVVIVLAGLALLASLVVIAVRALRRHDAEAADKQLVELARLQAETAVRIEGMRDLLAGRQAELHRAVNERLDSVSHHLNQSMTTSRQHTVESLQKLNERLVVIDNAQRNITDLASQVTSLQGVLTNKQQRGAFVHFNRATDDLADGAYRSGCIAERLLRIPAYAVQQEPARLRRISSGPAPACDRCQISARSHHGVP